MSTVTAPQRASGGPLLRLLVPGMLNHDHHPSMRAALSSFIGRLWTIDWLTQVGKQFFTSCRKALMSSYLRYPATSLCVLGKQEFYLSPMT